MSGIAAFCTAKKTILLSDGIAVYVEGLKPGPDMKTPEDKIYSRNFNKIIKVNNQVALQWIGSEALLMNEFAPIANGTGAEVAEQLSAFLRRHTDPSLYNEDWYCVNINVHAYENGRLMGYHVTSGGDIPFKPSKIAIPNGVYCSAVLTDNREATTKLKSLYKGPHPTFKDGAVKAFTAFVQQHPRLGGEIFCEVIQSSMFAGALN